jgi:hypothetical protein
MRRLELSVTSEFDLKIVIKKQFRFKKTRKFFQSVDRLCIHFVAVVFVVP